MKISQGVGDGWKNIVNYCLKLNYTICNNFFAPISYIYRLSIPILSEYIRVTRMLCNMCVRMQVCASDCKHQVTDYKVNNCVNTKILKYDWLFKQPLFMA